MVQEADQYRAEDEVQREKVTAKNSLESLAFHMKSTVEDEKLQGKISPEDKQRIIDKCNKVISWLDRNQTSLCFAVLPCGWLAVLTVLFYAGRLSKEDIERMVQEADQYRAEDEVQREKVTAKNSLESLAFHMKSTVEDEKLQGKISPEDKQRIIDKCNEVISWLDRNQMAEKDEYDHQQKELEKLCNPIITKLYQGGAAGGGMPGGMPGGFPGGAGGASSGPTIEEVD
ncbi:UNVERIFIED_CONTAM: hypothetical protein FKN15_010383 [Acipenser sinensis]